MTFKSLVSIVSEQFQEIKQSLALLPYFETLEPELIAEFCRVSSVMVFPPEEIILGPYTGNSHEVYFILEGVCRMVESLLISIAKKSHQTAFYKLHKHSHSKSLNFELINVEYKSRLFNQNHRFQKQAEVINGNFNEKAKSCGISKSFASAESKSGEENWGESNCQILGIHSEATRNNTVVDEKAKVEISTPNLSPSEMSDNREVDKGISKEKKNSGNEVIQKINLESFTEIEKKKTQGSINKSEVKQEAAYEFGNHLKVLEECKKIREDMFRVIKKAAAPEKPKNTKCFFIETGFLLRGACFGLEKSEKDNFIISATAVKCLKIPLRFLLQHNPCNIWNRIRLFHSLYLPKKEKIFDYFRSDRRWMEEKKMRSVEIVSLKNMPLYASLSEVPYSIRLKESQFFF